MKLAVLCLSSVSALLVLLTAPAPGRELDPPDSATVTDGSTAFPGHYEEPDDPAAQYAHHEAPSDAPAPGPAVLEGQISSPALVWIRDGYESIQVNVNAQGNNIVGDAANEPSIAIDPTNPSRMAIGWRQFDTIRSDFRQSGGAYSHDGGQTWTFPGVLEPGVFSSDPVLDYDADGRFYYYALQPYRVPAVSWECYMYRSDDGGVTWPQEVFAWGGDKAWIAIDRTDGMGRGNIYCAWSVNAACCGSNVFTRSTDGGLNFSAPTPIPESPRFGTVTVGPDGEVYIAGYSGTFSDLAVAKSTNARDPFATPVFNQVVFVNMGGSIASSSGPNPGGLLGQLWITADHSNGPSHGNVYVLSSIDPVGSDPLDVHFIRSTDGGLTWSAPVRVNDDPLNNGAWQWFGTMSVAPNGRIDAIWNDTRADPVEEHSELYYSSSADQGLTWSENVPLSPQFNHFLGYPMQYKLGDYYDMISDNFGVSIAYAATFNGEQDVYYLRVGDFDCNNNGVPDQQDIADETSPDCNANDVPDECDRDCNDNGLVDECEVLDSISPDCDGNLVPDECDPDFDGDDFIDACDPDIDEDGVLNEDDHCDFTPAELISQGFIMADGRPIGDIDLSCVIDLPDWNNFMLRWLRYGGPGALQTPYWTDWYDYDEDHDIDLRDFNEFMKAFGQE